MVYLDRAVSADEQSLTVTLEPAPVDEGDATPDRDYRAIRGWTVTFQPGESVKALELKSINDRLTEGTERVEVLVSQPTSDRYEIGDHDMATVFLKDNERWRWQNESSLRDEYRLDVIKYPGEINGGAWTSKYANSIVAGSIVNNRAFIEVDVIGTMHYDSYKPFDEFDAFARDTNHYALNLDAETGTITSAARGSASTAGQLVAANKHTLTIDNSGETTHTVRYTGEAELRSTKNSSAEYEAGAEFGIPKTESSASFGYKHGEEWVVGLAKSKSVSMVLTAESFEIDDNSVLP